MTTFRGSVLRILAAALMAAAGAPVPLAAAETGAASDAPPATSVRGEIRKWQSWRFGMFIHWGPVSLTGKEISWSRANSNTNSPNHGPVPVEVYDNLYRQFNPTNFDAPEWVSVAKDAGMKYMVFTAKHCDGFLFWDSKADPYTIIKSPYGRDVCAQLSKAAAQQGMPLGWYYSPMDWRDPDCRSANNDRFVAKMQAELKELLSGYGPIGILWFDTDARPAPWHPESTYSLVRGLQPGLLINNRLEISTGKEWSHQGGPLKANVDFYTPEQKIGDYDDRYPWETCMTLGTQWSWKPGDKIKSASEVLGILARTAGGDGNLLLDVGPMPDGRIEPRQVEVLHQVGNWLKENGESIYGTRGGPYMPTERYAATRKGEDIYLHLLKMENATLVLPPLPVNITEASLLGGGKVFVDQGSGSLTIRLEPTAVAASFPGHPVVRLRIKGNALEIPSIRPSPLTTKHQ
jgi:alpha-L-fucosidase